MSNASEHSMDENDVANIDVSPELLRNDSESQRDNVESNSDHSLQEPKEIPPPPPSRQFETFEELFTFLQEFYRDNGAALVKKNTAKKRGRDGVLRLKYVKLACDRQKSHPSKSTGLRQRKSSKKPDCPFTIVARCNGATNNFWVYEPTGSHNHEASSDPSTHLVFRRRTSAQNNLSKSLLRTYTSVRDMSQILSNSSSTPSYFKKKDIYNDRQRFRKQAITDLKAAQAHNSIFWSEPHHYPKMSAREQLNKIWSISLNRVIGEVSPSAPLETFIECKVVGVVVPIEELRCTRVRLGLIALRPLLLAEAPTSRVLTSLDVQIVEECADAIIARTCDEIVTFKAQTGSVEVIYIGPIQAADSLPSMRQLAFDAGAQVVILKDPSERNAEVYPDMETLTPLPFLYGLSSQELSSSGKVDPCKPLIKVSGIKTLGAAIKALKEGANMICLSFIPGQRRPISIPDAIQITNYVHTNGHALDYSVPLPSQNMFEYRAKLALSFPQVVGVFQNQSLTDVMKIVGEVNLDIVQLQGEEPLEWCNVIPVPVIKSFTPGTARFKECLLPGYFKYAVLESKLDGDNRDTERSLIATVVAMGARFIMGGGLTPQNVADAVKLDGIVGVDAAGGVETAGEMDTEKVRLFIANALAASSTT